MRHFFLREQFRKTLVLKALLHCAIIRATCVKNVSRTVAETVVESIIEFYFRQRLQRIF